MLIIQSSILRTITDPTLGQSSLYSVTRPNLGSPGKLQGLLMALEEFGLGFEQALDDALQDLARLVLELVLWRAKDLLEHADKLGCQALDGGLVGLVWKRVSFCLDV